MLCMWLGLAHFHNGYSFLMISPKLLDIWPVFFLILWLFSVGQQKIASTAQQYTPQLILIVSLLLLDKRLSGRT